MKRAALMLASVCAAISTTAPAAGTDCAALYQQHLASDMELSWRAFDQTEGSGFRVLASAGCYREAGDLIAAYLQAQERRNHSLHWHLAQMRAEEGENEAAIAAARRSLRSDEAADAAFKWNDYVRAVIAFLAKDRVAFDRHVAVLAAHDDDPGNAMNLGLLRKLEAGFGGSYRDALRAVDDASGDKGQP